MKKICLFLCIIIFGTRCSKELDIEDVSNYQPEQVWNDLQQANAFVANLYNKFGNWNVAADRNSEQLSGIAFGENAITVTGASTASWDYANVRLANLAIRDVQAGKLSQSEKESILAQAYFMRAYTYFSMVKEYGGVPIVKTPLDRYNDELDLPRNSTRECFDFIMEDLDKAIALLPARIDVTSTDWGHIDGNFAQAFKAKVLLYKASPLFNPGNPWSNAYWADAYTENKKAYESLRSQGYGLIEDYAKIALSEKNSEIVFPVINKFPGKTAGWDFGARPGSLSRGNASACPTWEFVKTFPMKDGKLYDDPTGTYYKTDAAFLQSYWKNRDPRFEKSILWNARTFPVAGTPKGYKQYTSVGIASANDNFGINPNVADKSTNNNTYTGFFILKNCNLSLTQPNVQQYDIDFVLMRFAEVMLNYAETANEAGHTADALVLLREIRKRAGIEPGAGSMYGITAVSRTDVRQAIMNERNIELCFEGHRFNDLRRWRLFSLLDQKTKSGVEAIAINANGTEMPILQAQQQAGTFSLSEEHFKYSVVQVPQTGVQKNIVPDKYYFYPIAQSIINKTTKLEQNKDWGGSFDPTLH
ncbi:RagB/SusD family nutrient uptake outer membrane protein [Niabella pedocola]|uniref:RagB/SusD family nutrient uptake outer membrane protein n=1 Tax=Niabella pedocola TaxID=1752077 RepID=A0ABS8PPC7_9BACT|nr:RagB/SusD family nutrient uptake outer membrane protein [Niabella pedocola]MCD2422949.1 RagB/SusD family nutrient uptake outer membrane protein [Niabella pedocola]